MACTWTTKGSLNIMYNLSCLTSVAPGYLFIFYDRHKKTLLHFHTWLNVTIELFGDCKKTFETNMVSFVGYIYFYIVSSIRVNTE